MHACEIWQIKHRFQEVWKLSELIDVWNRKCVLNLLFTVSLVSFWPKMEFLSSRSWRCIGNVLPTGRVQQKLEIELDLITKIWNFPWDVKDIHKTKWNHWATELMMVYVCLCQKRSWKWGDAFRKLFHRHVISFAALFAWSVERWSCLLEGGAQLGWRDRLGSNSRFADYVDLVDYVDRVD